MTVRIPTPDPVEDPAGYRRLLLSLLGDDDPAEAQASTPAAIRELVVEAGSHLTTSPEPGEWSALGCIAHMTDAEMIATVRYRWIVAHDEPSLVGYDQDRWVERLHADDRDAGALVGVFEPLRRANLEMWARSTPDDRARVGLHQERGPESYDLTFRLVAGHDRFHLDQARRALAAVRG
jgi:hypothetical protein